MSHFTVLVVGDDPEAQLAPFQENNTGDCPKQYLAFNDVEDEYRKQWAESKEHQAEYKTFENFIRKWAGYSLDAEKGRYGYWENPNRKWDWYSLGGRWRGFFRMKEATVAKIGKPGLSEMMYGEENHSGKSDAARKGDIDFAAMRRDAATMAGKQWDKAHSIIKGRAFKSWSDVRDAHGNDIDAARLEYNTQEVVQDFKRCDDFGVFDGPEAYAVPRERYCATAANGAGSTFAVIKDGQWYEKGAMGWWGCVSDAKHEDAWRDEFAKLIDDLPDDTLLSVYDCHI